MKARRRARGAALQALFEVDLAGHDPSRVLQQRLQICEIAPDGSEFARHLVEGVLNYLPEIDPIIREIAPEWPLEQMSPMDRNILRVAIFEMIFDPDIPIKVAINEAVELAKLFGSESSRRFVNGALGTLASKQLSIQRQSETT
ncbi:MAG TPA: transcription antitermination factor NusB [Anaerolineae bacterium]|nr:transcription antitermination factor NusB [Anaerolineae bacterium]